MKVALLQHDRRVSFRFRRNVKKIVFTQKPVNV